MRLLGQEREAFETVAVVEIFTVAGATPPNMHSRRHEMFYVRYGEASPN